MAVTLLDNLAASAAFHIFRIGGHIIHQIKHLFGVEKVFDGADIAAAKLGVFGKGVKADYQVQEGDRVEIYRPLIADPKEVRKKRAEKAKGAAAK